MTIVKNARDEDVKQCDGCGRTQGGPGDQLDIGEYVVNDPNQGTPVIHHYDVHCAQNRGLDKRTVNTIPGWEASTTQIVDVATQASTDEE